MAKNTENIPDPIVAAPPEPGTRMVTIKIPMNRDDINKPDVFVSLNEKTWQIKRGVQVTVPDYVAQFLEMREDQIEKNINAIPKEK